MKKLIIVAVIALLVGGVAGYFLAPSPMGSAVGTTFSTAKVAQINFSPTNNATSTSLLNTDSYDRIVTDSFGFCNTVGTSLTAVTGDGLKELTFNAATTTTSAPNTVTNVNYVMQNIVATSSTNMYFSSTTIAVNAYGRVWASGSYMTFWSNATNTAVCTVGVHYIGS